MKEICFEQIDSTNTYCKNNYQNLDDCTIVSAKSQSSGKGRNNRIWQSNKDENLLFSLCLKNEKYFSYFKEISIVSALSVLQILKQLGLDDLMIKWPNDVYCQSQKITGILLEAVSTNSLQCLIVGIGINVNQTTFDDDCLIKPTSLKLQLNKDIPIDDFKQKIYQQLLKNIEKLTNGYDFYNEVKQYDYLKDLQCYGLINNEKKLINVVGINKDYSLKVRYEDREYDLQSGEISFHV